MEPKSVVPAVATTAMGISPSSRQARSSCARATVCIRWSRSTGSATTASGGSPSSRADFCTLKWLACEVKTRSFAAWSLLASSRASSSAWRLDWVPPEVNTPSAAGPSPTRSAVQSISLRSMRVPPADWSQVSREELTADSTASPSTAGITTGQLRWAR